MSMEEHLCRRAEQRTWQHCVACWSPDGGSWNTDGERGSSQVEVEDREEEEEEVTHLLLECSVKLFHPHLIEVAKPLSKEAIEPLVGPLLRTALNNHVGYLHLEEGREGGREGRKGGRERERARERGGRRNRYASNKVVEGSNDSCWQVILTDRPLALA